MQYAFSRILLLFCNSTRNVRHWSESLIPMQTTLDRWQSITYVLIYHYNNNKGFFLYICRAHNFHSRMISKGFTMGTIYWVWSDGTHAVMASSRYTSHSELYQRECEKSYIYFSTILCSIYVNMSHRKRGKLSLSCILSLLNGHLLWLYIQCVINTI